MDNLELQDLAEYFGYTLESFQNVDAALALAKSQGILSRDDFERAVWDGTIDTEYRENGVFLTIDGTVA